MLQHDPSLVNPFFEHLARTAGVGVAALTNVVFKKLCTAKKGEASDEELIEFGALCRQAGLNPLTSEVAPMYQGGRVSLIVSVDGWIKVAMAHPDFLGYRLNPSEETEKFGPHEVPKYIDAEVKLAGKEWTFSWRTYFNEAKRDRSPVWASMPNHMLQVRALANVIKRTFGLCAYTPDEAEMMTEQNMQSAARSAVAERVSQQIAQAQQGIPEPQALPQKQPEFMPPLPDALKMQQPDKVPAKLTAEALEAQNQAAKNDLMAQAIQQPTRAQTIAAEAVPDAKPVSKAQKIKTLKLTIDKFRKNAPGAIAPQDIEQMIDRSDIPDADKTALHTELNQAANQLAAANL